MKSRFESALNNAPQLLADALFPILHSVDFDATISAAQFTELLAKTQMSDVQLRLALLPFAACLAHVDISGFQVGAIARGTSGRLYFGGNMEFAGIPLSQTIHAEQSAISHAWMKGETALKDLTVNFSPCGHCRQFMNELNGVANLKIQLPGREEKGLYDYLPDPFGPQDLGIESGLMAPVQQPFQTDSDDPLYLAAVNALNTSYAPYTQDFSGLALRTKAGAIYCGSYAENAAFNPSLPSLQVALNLLLLQGGQLNDIEAVVFAETQQAKISQRGIIETTLRGINPSITLHYISL